MNLYQWAIRWGVSFDALADFRTQMGLDNLVAPDHLETEASASKQTRLNMATEGGVLWRNNVGAVTPETYDGVSYIRYGLANDTPQMNKRVKSSDLIGVRPVLIVPEMVGLTIGQFVAREVKKPGWVYRATKREEAQRRFLEIVIGMGGDGAFTTGN